MECSVLNKMIPRGRFLCHLPFLEGILGFRPPGLGSYSMRATASCSYEGLVAPPIEPYAVDLEGYHL